ncbi:MAG TPA: endonuclease/exonuclease/phosphatase family protein [Pyrinomonadaceae bacterium]|nr:endonuclease/exonuclease/phosphatase family protein [Pyrinomonadaceae bacterium]
MKLRHACLFLAACSLLLAPGGLTSATLSSHADGPVVTATAELLETGSASKLAAERASAEGVATPTELKFVSYNIRYRHGEDLQRLIALLKTDAEIGGASVIGLQEVDRSKKRTKFTNTARVLAEALGMHYVWAAPPNARPKDAAKTKAVKNVKKDDDDGDDDNGGGSKEEEETGVAILSRYPLSDVSRLVLAHEGPNRRRRAAVGATVRVGREEVRFYSVHAETRMPVERKVEHWRTVLEDLAQHARLRRVAVVGDFNTIKGKDVAAARKLFTDAGFVTPFEDDRATFKVVFFDFKLDWIWLRGLRPVAHGIDKSIGLSDHWPLWVTVKLSDG